MYAYFLEGKMEEAFILLKQLKENGTATHIWKDHRLSQIALEVYYELKGKDPDLAKERARDILNLAIQLNPEDHKYAEYSLRFY